jgi:hypothetical protein
LAPPPSAARGQLPPLLPRRAATGSYNACNDAEMRYANDSVKFLLRYILATVELSIDEFCAVKQPLAKIIVSRTTELTVYYSTRETLDRI